MKGDNMKILLLLFILNFLYLSCWANEEKYKDVDEVCSCPGNKDRHFYLGPTRINIYFDDNNQVCLNFELGSDYEKSFFLPKNNIKEKNNYYKKAYLDEKEKNSKLQEKLIHSVETLTNFIWENIGNISIYETKLSCKNK